MSDSEPTVTMIGPSAELVQAIADLLAARVALYQQQPAHPLIPKVDAALDALVCPQIRLTLP